MPHSLFISDLHLCARRPRLTTRFLHFLEHDARHADALYILGDLFEYWAGDDDLDDAYNRDIVSALRRLSESDVRLYLMHGNRDFLMGERFAAACGGTWLTDPTLVDLHGTPTLLSHGDALCTADAEYQAFRLQVRNPAWQRDFLAQPLAERKRLIEALRERSEEQKQVKSYDIMDVTTQAVEQLLRAHGCPRLIHGHTHRPNHHRHMVDGHACERWVLPNWEEMQAENFHGGYLRCDPHGCARHRV
ncbi:MAG: UDP-2,3-diacylglucosamine diphosphatase [Pseudomonadota bacterium]